MKFGDDILNRWMRAIPLFIIIERRQPEMCDGISINDSSCDGIDHRNKCFF